MITAEEKQDLINWIKNLENQSLLQHLIEVNEANESVFQVSDQQREGIIRGLEDWKNGRVKTHKEFQNELKSKFPHLFQ